MAEVAVDGRSAKRLGELVRAHQGRCAIIGNGPSARGFGRNDFPETCAILRLNLFFLEEEPRYGRRVDGYFWALDNPTLHEGLIEAVRTSRYEVGAFFCPVAIDRLTTTNRMFFQNLEADGRLNDHWQLIGQRLPKVGRLMMSRPLPTIGIQALAAALAIGFRQIFVTGFDFYQSKDERYAYDIPKDVRNAMDAKHFTPGYEKGAHSLETDVRFLSEITRSFPSAEFFALNDNETIRKFFQPFNRAALAQLRPAPDASVQGAGSMPAQNNAGGARPAGAPSTTAARSAGTPIERPEPLHASLDEALRSKIRHERRFFEQKLSEVTTSLAQLRGDLGRLDYILNYYTMPDSPFNDLLVVAHDTTSLTGVHRPIQCYVNHVRHRFGGAVRLFNISHLKGAGPDRRGLATVQALLGFKKLLINSIACFEIEEVEKFIETASEIYIYLHETRWAVSDFERRCPAGLERFKKVASAAKLLCVSEAQKAYFAKEFGLTNAEVIYNTSAMLPDRQAREIISLRGASASDVTGPRRILMVGSIQPRKGSQLFGEVAAYAAKLGFDWEFVWVGKGNGGELFRTAGIEHPGPKSGDDLAREFQRCDLFFLPSLDDPFPLSALEALSFMKRVVCYRGVGTAELLGDLPGCCAFESYTKEAAFQAILSALGERPSFERIESLLREKIEVEAFSDRLNRAIGIDPGALPDRADSALEAVATRGKIFSLSSVAISHREDNSPVEVARSLMRKKDYAEAEKYLRASVLERPEDGNVQRCLADLLRQVGRPDEARQVLLHALDFQPEKASLHRDMATVLLENGAAEEAVHFARRAVQLNPQSTAAERVLKRVEAAISLPRAS